MNENELSKIVVDCCYKVHTTIGPGLLESVYEEVLMYEFLKRNLSVKRQQGIPVVYEAIKLELGFRADFIIEDKLIVEIKSLELIAPVHQKQVMTYLRLTNLRLGLLVNFNCALIKDGIQRIVNNL